MTVYQIVAKGSLSIFSGSGSIVSKEIYTALPSKTEKEAFRERCIKCDGAADTRSLDPKYEIRISVVSYTLIDNGKLL